MKIDIAKTDVWNLRYVIHAGLLALERNGMDDITASGRKMTRKLNRALIQIYGHSCMGDTYRT